MLAFAGPPFDAQLLTRMDVTRSAYAQFTFATGRADQSMTEKMRAYLSAMVVGWDTSTLRQAVERNLAPIVSPLIYPEAVALIAMHQQAGSEVILVSSTGADIASPIGQLLGVDRVLATEMVVLEGCYSGGIADYMFGERKGQAIRELAEQEGVDLTASYGCSDSVTDLPLLSSVGHPSAVNPDRDLRRAAGGVGTRVAHFGVPYRGCHAKR